jgi:hypothetical protein
MELDTIGAQGEALGNEPEITPSLESEQRVITSPGQAYAVAENLREDAKVLVANAAKIIELRNGRRPQDQKKLNNQNKGWKSNVSTGFMATQIARLVPRFIQPVKTAKYLTAASLPAYKEDGSPWPDGAKKTEWFRECMTDFIRSWPQWNFYVQGMAQEVAELGYCFNAYFDEYEWKPKLVRQDKGFVPKGTEVMDEPQFFMVRWQYKPHELLALLKANKDAGRKEWKEEACVKAINNASAPATTNTEEPEYRTFAELVRQGAYRYDYNKGYKVIETIHLFAKEVTGKVSHYVLWDDSQNGVAMTDGGDGLLFEKLDETDTMFDSCVPIVFAYGDGTIHGAWGAGQLLFDMAQQVEKLRNDSIDNMRLTNKQRLQVPEAKNINQVKVQNLDDMIVVTGANFAQNVGGIAPSPEAYIRLSAEMERYATEKVGQYVPPIPLQASDIKAAQVNAAMQKEEEVKNTNLDNWLTQFAVLAHAMTRRATRKDSPLPEVKKLRKKLLLRLTEEEIDVLRDQPAVQTVIDFTEYRAVQRAQFAGSVLGNQLFNQQFAAQTMASPLGASFAQAIVMDDSANNEQMVVAERAQILEANSFLNGVPVPVAPSDPHIPHYRVLKGLMVKAMETNSVAPQNLKLGLDHLSAHWAAATANKLWGGNEGNEEKSFIATVDKAIQESLAAQQQALAVQQQAMARQGMPMEQQAQPQP